MKEQVEFSIKENTKLLNMLSGQNELSFDPPAKQEQAGAPAGSAVADSASQTLPQGLPAATSALVSIIVPVYNAERYLKNCLDSLRAQSLEAIEIICVNNGSTDDSLAILHEYAELDPRIIVISQDNLGPSAARNAALRRAQAPYVMSCDADDSFDSNMCQMMLNTLVREDVDLVICGMRVIYDVSERMPENINESYRFRYFGKQVVTFQTAFSNNVSACNKIFKRELIDKYEIDFPEGLLFEDAYFYEAYMTAAQTVYFLPVPLYNYLRHDTSIMSTAYTMQNTSTDHLLIGFRLWDFLEKNTLLDSHGEYFWSRFKQYATFAFKHSKGAKYAEAKRLARAFIKERKSSFNKASFKTRTSIIILLNTKFKVLYAIYCLAQWLTGKLSRSDAPYNELIGLINQNLALEAQIKELLTEDAYRAG
ncbi:MAG: glycosyltransferase [Coriobacteriia bacterium]|nr:glycosyltransferase [Coriobacteriia bacterium]